MNEELEKEAEAIEMAAAMVAYDCEWGVSEWESFLTADQTKRLNELAQLGYGTWGRERREAS